MKYKILVVTLTFSAFSSCKKNFLNVPSESVIFRQDYVVDLKTAEEYLNGVYTDLATKLYKEYTLIYPELVADNVKPLNPPTTLTAQYSWQQQADESSSLVPASKNVNGISYSAYNLALNANYVIEQANKYKSQDPVKANALIGQALAVRALVHFYLVNIFAQSFNFTADASHPGVAYVKSSDKEQPVTRISVKGVYDNLVADLQMAISSLSSAGSNLRIGSNFAKALLARIFLFKEDFESSRNYALDVCTAVPVMTVNYPGKLFTAQESEAIFQLPPGPSISIANTEFTNFAGIYYRPSQVRFYATNDIAIILREYPGDLRRDWVQNSSGNWNILKFPSGVVTDVSQATGSYYQTLMRASEMYLTVAEALTRLGKDDSARQYLNVIRVRSGLPAVASTTGQPLLDSVRKERRRELAFEGLRMFDLLRWKQGVNRIDAISPDVQQLPYPSNKAIAPIPGLDVTISGLQQNPGY